MGETFTVAIAFEVTTRDYDPARFARMATRFADQLPPGSQTLSASAAVDGVASVSARVPSGQGAARALHSVVSALELAAADEPTGLDSLGHLRRAVVELIE